jgi:hypothetical protein
MKVDSRQLNVGELLWEFSVTAFGTLLALGIMLSVRMLRGRSAFTDKDWLALCGHTRQEVFSRRLLLRFGTLWLCVIAVTFMVGRWIVPLGASWVLASLIPLAIAVVLVTRWWMR